jgi:hypothetical protein
MLYSVGGTDGVTVLATGSAYDPTAGTWSAIAPMAHVREKPTGAFMNGKFYVVGGWGADGTPIAATEIYDPGTNTWSAAADSPVPLAGSSSAVLDGKLYVVGGCDASQCGHKETLVYDPDSDSWTKKAGYPGPIAWQSCGAVAGALLCAGGNTGAVSTKAAWSYSPGTDSWSPLPDMPLDLWGSAVTAANGLLLISGGVSGVSTVTNQGFAYDPSTRAWTAIANSNNAVYRGGSACGFYKIGGSTGNFSAVAAVEVLPGFGQCGAPADVPWLSESATNVTLAPGGTATLTVTMNAGAKVVTQPGAYTAQLVYGTDSPYPVTATAVTMTVTPPRSWGKITGTVTGLACDGTSAPLAGATVQVNSWAAHHTLITGKDGSYALWLDRRNNPLTVIVAKDGWQPQTRVLRVGATSTTTADWQLGKAPACP